MGWKDKSVLVYPVCWCAPVTPAGRVGGSIWVPVNGHLWSKGKLAFRSYHKVYLEVQLWYGMVWYGMVWYGVVAGHIPPGWHADERVEITRIVGLEIPVPTHHSQIWSTVRFDSDHFCTTELRNQQMKI